MVPSFSSVFCIGLVFPIASLRIPAYEGHANMLLPQGVLEEARNVLQRGCGAECLKEARCVLAPRAVRSVLCTQVLDTLVVQSPAENSSAAVCARVDAECLRFGLVYQHGAVIDWGSSLERLAENALRQVCNISCCASRSLAWLFGQCADTARPGSFWRGFRGSGQSRAFPKIVGRTCDVRSVAFAMRLLFR